MEHFSEKGPTKRRKIASKESKTKTSTTGKDSTLFFFHALGSLINKLPYFVAPLNFPVSHYYFTRQHITNQLLTTVGNATIDPPTIAPRQLTPRHYLLFILLQVSFCTLNE